MNEVFLVAEQLLDDQDCWRAVVQLDAAERANDRDAALPQYVRATELREDGSAPSGNVLAREIARRRVNEISAVDVFGVGTVRTVNRRAGWRSFGIRGTLESPRTTPRFVRLEMRVGERKYRVVECTRARLFEHPPHDVVALDATAAFEVV